MTTLDDGILNLRRFVANLVQATSALEQVTDHFEECERRFTQLQDEAGDEGGGLNDQLQELGTTLESGEKDAGEALGDLAQAATDGQQTITEAEDDLEQATSQVEQKAQAVVSDLDQAHHQLVDQGFLPLIQDLEEAERELEAQGQETGQAFTEWETTLQGLEAEAKASWDAAEGELDEAASDLAQDETALEGEATEAVRDFDSMATSLEQAGTALEGDVDTVHDLLDAGVQEQGQEWEQAVERHAREAQAFVEAGATQRLEQPAQTVEDMALASLTREYTALDAVLDSGAAVAGEVEPLAAELAKCLTVVGHIDKLLNAMA